jgi:hypothetical protein
MNLMPLMELLNLRMRLMDTTWKIVARTAMFSFRFEENPSTYTSKLIVYICNIAYFSKVMKMRLMIAWRRRALWFLEL